MAINSHTDLTERKCWACAADLRPGQLICTECNQWQTKRRFFAFSNSILTLLVALIAVIGAVIPPLYVSYRSSFPTYKASVTGFIQASGEKSPEVGASIKLFATSDGSKNFSLPETIECQLSFEKDGETKDRSFRFDLGSNPLVGRGETITYYSPFPGFRPERPFDLISCEIAGRTPNGYQYLSQFSVHYPDIGATTGIPAFSL